MIDQELVDKNVLHCIERLDSKTATAIGNLYQLNDFFTQDLVEKLLTYASITDSWHKLEKQEYLNRQCVTWEPESVFEETFMVVDQLTTKLNELFGKNFKFTGLQLWKDSAGYHIGKHIDNTRVGYSLQIYLTSGVSNLGTYFYNNDITVEIPYQVNAGYLTDLAQDVPHGMIRPVPNNHTRYSIYGLWA
jgi:hypothetical protein